MHLSREVSIAAPPSRVWAVMSDVERWPDWTPSVTEVRKLDPGPLGVGTRVRIRQPRFPPARWQVSAIDAGRAFTWINRGPGARVTAHHQVEPDGTGSRAILSIRFEGPVARLVGWVTEGITRRYLHLEAEGLKRRSEAG